MEKNKNRKDVVFAIFLIFIGTIFLLNSTGVVGWGIWEHILKFWPIFLILAGIKLIFEKSAIAEIIIGILALILFASVAIFSYISYTSQTLPFVPRIISRYIKENPGLLSPESTTLVEEREKILLEDYDIEKIESRKLNIDVGTSKFILVDDNELNNYLNLSSSYSKGFTKPNLDSRLKDNSLDINFKTNPASGFNFSISFWSTRQSSSFNLALGQTDLLTDIDINLGAGKGEVHLDSVNLRNITSKVGAGKLNISLEEMAIPENLIIELGAGKITVTIPENVGYELSYNLGVGRILINENSIAEFVGEDDSFKSPNFEDADEIIKIDAKVGVGSLEIIQE